MKRSKGLTIEYADGVVITNIRRRVVYVFLGLFIFVTASLIYNVIFILEQSFEESVLHFCFLCGLLLVASSNLYSKRVVTIRGNLATIQYYVFKHLVLTRLRKLIAEKYFIYCEKLNDEHTYFDRVKISDLKTTVFLFDIIEPNVAQIMAKEISAYLGIDLVISDN